MFHSIDEYGFSMEKIVIEVVCYKFRRVRERKRERDIAIIKILFFYFGLMGLAKSVWGK